MAILLRPLASNFFNSHKLTNHITFLLQTAIFDAPQGYFFVKKVWLNTSYIVVRKLWVIAWCCLYFFYNLLKTNSLALFAPRKVLHYFWKSNCFISLSASRLRVCAAHKIAYFQLRRGTRLLPDFLVQGCFPFSQEICIGGWNTHILSAPITITRERLPFSFPSQSKVRLTKSGVTSLSVTCVCESLFRFHLYAAESLR